MVPSTLPPVTNEITQSDVIPDVGMIIAQIELYAIQWSLQMLGKHLRNKTICIRTDNQNARDALRSGLSLKF